MTWDLGLETFVDVDAFYAADEARRLSGESDFGVWWWDGVQGHSDQWRVSAVEATGEIYAVCERPLLFSSHRGRVLLLGRIGESDLGYTKAEVALRGWNLECGSSSSLQWALDRVRLAAAASLEWEHPFSVLLRHSTIGGHVNVDVFMGRTAGSRGKAGELMFREEEWPVFRDALRKGLGDQLELVDRVADAAKTG